MGWQGPVGLVAGLAAAVTLGAVMTATFIQPAAMDDLFARGTPGRASASGEYVPGGWGGDGMRTRPGMVAVRLPKGVQTSQLRVTLLQGNEVAHTTGRMAVKQIPAMQLVGRSLDPGAYVARFVYRGRALPELQAVVRPGGRTVIVVPRAHLAEAEYLGGLQAAKDGKPDVPFFQRALKMNPKHLGAHLQLAAFQMAHGTRVGAERHLHVVRQEDPQNKDLERVERMLLKRTATAQ